MSRLIKWENSTLIQEHARMIKLKNLHVNDGDEGTNPIDDQRRQEIIQYAEIEARKLIEEAQSHASELLAQIESQKSDWQQEKEDLMQKAYEEGFRIGIVDGKKQGHSEYENLITQARHIVNQSKTAFVEHVESAETTILELAVASAERIIHTSLSEENEKFLPLVKKVLKEARDFKEVQIHVHPSQYELLISEKNELDAVFPNGIQCFVYPDSELEEYACYIESENGRIDASVSSQLVELKAKLMEMLEGER